MFTQLSICQSTENFYFEIIALEQKELLKVYLGNCIFKSFILNLKRPNKRQLDAYCLINISFCIPFCSYLLLEAHFNISDLISL